MSESEVLKDLGVGWDGVCLGYITHELGNGESVESGQVWWSGVNLRLGQQEQRAEFWELGHEVKTGWAVWLNWFEADLRNRSLTIPYIFLPERLAHSYSLVQSSGLAFSLSIEDAYYPFAKLIPFWCSNNPFMKKTSNWVTWGND